MADVTIAARPYGVAAFQFAQDEGKVPEWSEMLDLISTVASDRLLKGLLANPKVNTDELVGLVIDVCGDGLSASGKNFVRLLGEYRRLGIIHSIKEVFTAQREAAEGSSRVEVSSPYPLDDAQRKSVVESLTARLGRQVELTETIDETLIGGILIRAGDLVIDATLKGRLGQLSQNLGRL